MRVIKNKIVFDSEILIEFLDASLKGVLDGKFIHFIVKKGKFSMISEGRSARTIAEHAVDYFGDPFYAGVSFDKMCSVGKRLYKGEVSLSFAKNFLTLKLDNITAKFPISSNKTTFSLPKTAVLEEKVSSWIVDGLLDAAIAVEETAKTKNTSSFYGVLFDTDDQASRICRFSNTALYFSKSAPIFTTPFRMVFPDLLAILAKKLKKSIDKVVISGNMSGFLLKRGTYVLCPMFHDTYPKDYLGSLGLSIGDKLVPGVGYRFDKDALTSAVELVSVSLGDSEFWTIFSIVGEDEEGCFVWDIFGKSFSNFEVSEKVVSSPGNGTKIERFGINKKMVLKALSIFKDVVFLHDYPNMVALTDESGNRVMALTKSVV
ncbi:hypothetical protein N8Z24_00210 [bacterium]|nr:hypothetical protein [bacterium]